MAIVTKYWGNGDELTLETGVGTIEVTSDENTTGLERHMNVTVKTTSGSPQQSEVVLIRQNGDVGILSTSTQFLNFNDIYLQA